MALKLGFTIDGYGNTFPVQKEVYIPHDGYRFIPVDESCIDTESVIRLTSDLLDKSYHLWLNPAHKLACRLLGSFNSDTHPSKAKEAREIMSIARQALGSIPEYYNYFR